MIRKKLLVANWKMYLSPKKTLQLALDAQQAMTANRVSASVVICPSAENLSAVCQLTQQSKSAFSVGAQNCSWLEYGPATGEVSAMSLEEIGCSYVLVGHSERRSLCLESDEMISKKMQTIVSSKRLTPILCIGESLADRKKGRTEKVLTDQLLSACIRLSESRKTIIVAYEPVWAVGSGQPLTKSEFADMLILFKKTIAKRFSDTFARSFVRFLYGGSVTQDSVLDYVSAGADGVLIGGASTRKKTLIPILKKFA